MSNHNHSISSNLTPLSEEQKLQLLKISQKTVKNLKIKIGQRKEMVRKMIKNITRKLNVGYYGKDNEYEVAKSGVLNSKEQIEHFEYLSENLFYNKCNAKFEGKEQEFYIGMYTFPQGNIYSWVSPIATVRFDSPGEVSYKLPNGNSRSGELIQKDNYLIQDSKIRYYSSESIDYPHSLIFQEEFKTGTVEFGLKNIVRQMEKYQDEIIRIPHKGSMLIKGPAGSGKTTLAFHRIAFLNQFPQTKELFPQRKIIVFVQDESTSDYF